MSLFLRNESTDASTLFGSTTTDGSGVARYSLGKVARMPNHMREPLSLVVRVESEGYSPVSWSRDLSPAKGEVLEMEVDLEPSEQSVQGYVYDPAGQPVAGAHVSLVSWGPQGIDPETERGTTSPGGQYHFAIRSYGPISLMASHAAHGVARGEGVLTLDEANLDISLHLEPAQVLSGRIVAIDGTPLPGIELQVDSVEGDVSELSHSVSSGPDGAFRFAALGPWQYYLHSSLLGSEEPVVRSGRRDVELRSVVPTAEINILLMDGQALRNQSPSVRSVVREGDSVRQAHSRYRDEWFLDDRTYLAFVHPGLHSISSTYESDGVIYSAAELIDIGDKHQVVELRLAPQQRLTQHFELLGPEGETIEEFSMRVQSLENGAPLDYVRAPADSFSAEPGSVRLTVYPKGASFVMPFEVDAEVSEDRAPLVVRGTRYGGRIRFSLGIEGLPKGSLKARLYNSKGEELNDFKVKSMRATTRGPLPPGAYTVVVSGNSNHERHSIPVTVKAGEVTTGSAFVALK